MRLDFGQSTDAKSLNNSLSSNNQKNPAMRRILTATLALALTAPLVLTAAAPPWRGVA